MPDELTIKLGNYEVIALESENPTSPANKIKSGFVRYNGMMPDPKGEGVLVFEVGRHDPEKTNQTANPIYFPRNGKILTCRVDTSGRTVVLEIVKASPLEVMAINKTPTPGAVDD